MVESAIYLLREVQYLGRLISEKGYRPDPENTDALDCILYLGFWATIARILKPVYDLLQVNSDKNGGKKHTGSKIKIEWRREHQVIIGGNPVFEIPGNSHILILTYRLLCIAMLHKLVWVQYFTKRGKIN